MNVSNNKYGNSNSDFEMGFMDDTEKIQSIQSSMRLGFIKKVYGILSVQLLITTLFSLISMTSTSFLKFQMNNLWLFYFCIAMTLVLPCVIVCFQGAMRQSPYNYGILFSFTFAESYLVSVICGLSNPKLVFMAAFMTMGMTIALTVYAMTTKTDFTLQGGMIFVIGCAFAMFSLFALFSSNNFVHILICVGGIIMFGIYLIYDTQLILGKHTLSFEIDDYILASFMLYVDIIQLFLYILEFLQRVSGNNNN
jgi:FtsH-binding integral membrane protein